MEAFKKIFDSFSSVSKEEWKEKLISELKGKPFEELIWKDEDGIEHQPYYNAEDLNFESPLLQKKEAWKILQTYDLKHWSVLELKEELKVAFENGLELAVITAAELTDEMADNFSEFDHLYWQSNTNLAQKNQLLDPIGKAIQEGDSALGSHDPAQSLGEGKILINGLIYAQKGATASQEIAYVLRHIAEYFDLLTDAGMSPKQIADRMIVKCSIGSSYFAQLSKIRALRMNLKCLFAHYELDQEPLIWAESNAYYLDSESFNNNLIRLSSQAMSAVLGNSDWVSLSLQAAGKNQKQFAARMSRNIQLILKHESHLDKVDDLVRGAYYIESLSSQFMESSWEHFLAMEKKGSLLQELAKTDFWKEIEEAKNSRLEAYQSGKKIMVGVNKYPFVDDLKGGRLKEVHDSLSDHIKKEA